MIRVTAILLALALLAGPVLAAPAHLPDPAEFLTDSPQKALAEFILAWEARNWTAMARLCQLSWRARQEKPAEFLRKNFGNKHLRAAEIDGVHKACGGFFPSFTCATVSATIKVETPGGRTGTILIHARLFKEKAPKKRSEQGTWGVNPLSLAGLVGGQGE